MLVILSLFLRCAGLSQIPTSGGESTGVYRVAGGITAPRIIDQVRPSHPIAPGVKPIEGVVVLNLIVDSRGNPRNIRVQRSLRPDYDTRAMQAVSEWHFSPATKDGQPVAVLISVEVNFIFDPPDLKGHFTGPSVYENRALGMTLTLPGEWQFFDKEMQLQMGLHPAESTKAPGCSGALCDQDIDVALISKPGAPPVGTIFMIGFRIPPQYLDRKRYPLEKFAEGMMKASLGSSDWVPVGGMSSITLGGLPAYRLLVHKMSGDHDMKGFGYVAESNGRVFLIVASAAPSADAAPMLRSSIENMTFSSSKP